MRLIPAASISRPKTKASEEGHLVYLASEKCPLAAVDLQACKCDSLYDLCFFAAEDFRGTAAHPYLQQLMEEFAAPLSVIRRLEADHAVLRQALVRQETALETLTELLQNSSMQGVTSQPGKKAESHEDDGEPTSDQADQAKPHPSLSRGTAFV
ncbi:hypothetical protein AK812_SmicGene41494, partial [Symbiodinium microadriaticum]